MRYQVLFCVVFLSSSALAQWEAGNWLSDVIVKAPSRVLTANVGYGYAAPNREDIVANFSRGGALNAMLGVKRFLESDYDASQLDYAHIFLFVSLSRAAEGRLRDTLARRLTPIGFSNFRFGFGARDGVGYRFQKYAVLTPYVSSGQACTTNRWSWDTVFVGDAARLDRFAGGFRYATFSEAGVMIDVGTRFAIDFGFETMLVQPRYVFLQSFSNLILQQAAHILMRKAIDVIFPNSWIPVAGFALKGAFNFWLYDQKSRQANFPFPSEAGLQILTFRVGASFSIE
ncbi:MAG: hypothetical protein NZM06_04325 [Chloroherpetonaceae bacterium]|nr:hypothetical protein [Chloroherpetonaceae bacterium]MDW8436779.1 hypothetical protein [Chloroherpetonaceae bacterium]